LAVAELVAAATDGVAIPRSGAEALDIRVYLGDRPREPDDLKSLRIQTDGGPIPLSQIAEVRLDSAPATLRRRNQSPVVVVTASPPAEAALGAREQALRLANEARGELRLSGQYGVEWR
jgi:multidrug efflux pump subunit AcrB